MAKHIIATLLFLYTIDTLADVKNREKARFDLISSIEVLVNIDECRKDVHANVTDSGLPRACNSLPLLSKYFFDVKKDRAAIDQYLDNEEAKIKEEALSVVEAYKFTKLGKMTLSSKCVKNIDPVDLDIYLDKIKGIPTVNKEENAATELKPQLIPMEPVIRGAEPRNPAMDKHKIEEQPLKARAPQSVPDGLLQQELSSE